MARELGTGYFAFFFFPDDLSLSAYTCNQNHVCLFVREVLICTVATRLVLLHFLPPRSFIFVPDVAVLLPVVSADELEGATTAMLILRPSSVLPSR